MATMKSVWHTLPAMEWTPIDELPPSVAVLVWTEGRCAVACLVEGVSGGKRWRVFMDQRTDDLLPWPSHWMPLPAAPVADEIVAREFSDPESAKD